MCQNLTQQLTGHKSDSSLPYQIPNTTPSFLPLRIQRFTRTKLMLLASPTEPSPILNLLVNFPVTEQLRELLLYLLNPKADMFTVQFRTLGSCLPLLPDGQRGEGSQEDAGGEEEERTKVALECNCTFPDVKLQLPLCCVQLVLNVFTMYS